MADSLTLTPVPKVRLIITGGTICMRAAQEEGISMSGLGCAPLEEYLRSQPELSDPALPDYDVNEWESLIDSSDVTGDVWDRLVSEISETYDEYDGFVVLHGTDSLAYTASALSFMLENLNKPVIVTGAMLPMSHIHTDARRNVTVSLLMAGFSKVPEVLVVFGSKILRGCRTTKANCTSMDAFDSPNASPLGQVGIDVTIAARSIIPATTEPLKPFRNMMPNSVIVLTVTPAFPPFLIRHIAAREERPLGIVLQLFGTGTGPTGNPKFQEAIQFAIASGVSIVAVTQCHRGVCSLLTYENGVKLHSIGVIEGKDMTTEAAFAKMAFLLGQGYSGSRLQALMEKGLRGELTEQQSKITGQASLRHTHSPSVGPTHPTDILSPNNAIIVNRRRPEEDPVQITTRRQSVPVACNHAEFVEGITMVGARLPPVSSMMALQV
eukprot:Gregarina_sp_Pseudo_9__5205@NODE_572_length_2559_cov_26_754365_g541_i0_p1_GENE_NODE_572_length_2559_cov_26_754365_g541_i0NODE_572_length_2559_cov_26_754365_g541_i0_p1_ORF_typecomplete_len438_score69_28Asparaginase/PF00710_20/1_3e60Asparaginase_C/PF17763_1/3_5e23GM_CSF/PF01109_17/0_26_NODE_572_length_2559_cov_26_754365_g541_i011232436